MVVWDPGGEGLWGGGEERDISNNLKNKDFLKRVSKTDRAPHRKKGGW